jgi:hypothetical protein
MAPVKRVPRKSNGGKNTGSDIFSVNESTQDKTISRPPTGIRSTREHASLQLLSNVQVGNIRGMLSSSSTDDGWRGVGAFKGLGVETRDLESANNIDTSGGIIRTLSLFNMPMEEVVDIAKHCLTLTKILYLRNWEVKDKDVKEMIRGFPKWTEQFSDLNKRVASNFQTLRNKIFEKTLVPWVEENVKYFNRATGIADEALGDEDSAGGHNTINSKYRRLIDEKKVRFSASSRYYRLTLN